MSDGYDKGSFDSKRASVRCSLGRRNVAVHAQELSGSWRECFAKVAENQAVGVSKSKLLSLLTEIERQDSLGRTLRVMGSLPIDLGDKRRLRLTKSVSEFLDGEFIESRWSFSQHVSKIRI